MRSSWSLGLLLAAAATACGGDEDAPSFEPAGGACGTVEPPDAPAPVSEDCFVVDTDCPAEPPQSGAACAGALACEYDDDLSYYSCGASGRWEPELEGSPPLGELCLDPFDGEIAGARVVLGPVGPGPLEPFADCAPLDLVYGEQGGAMVPFRLQIDGVDDVPECLLVETRMTVGGTTFDASGTRAATHCGQSLLIYSVVPWDLEHFLCPAPDEVVLELEVDVQGIGRATARVLVETPRACEDEQELG